MESKYEIYGVHPAQPDALQIKFEILRRPPAGGLLRMTSFIVAQSPPLAGLVLFCCGENADISLSLDVYATLFSQLLKKS